MVKTHLQLIKNSIQQDIWQLQLIKQCDKDILYDFTSIRRFFKIS